MPQVDLMKFEEHLEQLGEWEVRPRLGNRIWNTQKMVFAESWLERKQSERDDEIQSEHIAIARSAADAAWAAARAAKRANYIAVSAVIIAVVSMVVTFVWPLVVSRPG